MLLHMSKTVPQVDCKAEHDKNPGHGIGLGTVDPAKHKCPTRHWPVQAAACVDRPVMLPKVPFGHGVEAVMPATGQYELQRWRK